MSSAAQQTREKRQRTRGDLYAQRPAHEPFNSPVPKYGHKVQHAMTEADHIVIQAMESLKPVDLKGGIYGQGRVLRNASITRISKASTRFTITQQPMAPRTVAYRLCIMQGKSMIRRFDDENRPKNSPFGTSWHLIPYDTTLQIWHDDPNIGTIGPKRAFAVRNKGRHLCTPQELIDWKFDGVAAAADPRAHAGEFKLPGEAAAEQAAPPPAAAAPPDLSVLMEALIDVSGRGTLDDAGFIWQEVLRSTGNRALPEPADVARIVRQMGKTWRAVGQQKPLDHGLIKRKISGHLETWHREQSKARAAGAQTERWEREQRINRIAERLREVEAGNLPPPDLALVTEWLSVTAADELEAARDLVQKLKARSA